jgi:hypothetical protein
MSRAIPNPEVRCFRAHLAFVGVSSENRWTIVKTIMYQIIDLVETGRGAR